MQLITMNYLTSFPEFLQMYKWCNIKNWNQTILIAHIKRRKTTLASQLQGDQHVWEDKKKLVSLHSTSSLSAFYLFSLFITDKNICK